MRNRALSTARTFTGTAVAAAALGTAVLGVHLATNGATASAAGTTASSPSEDGQVQQQPQQSAPQQQDGGGLLGFSGFGRLQAPSGGSHSSSHGS